MRERRGGRERLGERGGRERLGEREERGGREIG